MRARFLEEENNALKLEVEELKKENGDLREMMQSLEEKIEKVASSRQWKFMHKIVVNPEFVNSEQMLEEETVNKW